MSASDLEEFRKILTNPKMSELAGIVDGINPEIKNKAKRTDSLDIIELQKNATFLRLDLWG